MSNFELSTHLSFRSSFWGMCRVVGLLAGMWGKPQVAGGMIGGVNHHA
jgi:hypothetical protein